LQKVAADREKQADHETDRLNSIEKFYRHHNTTTLGGVGAAAGAALGMKYGAATGSAIAPGIGTAIGAIIGVLGGYGISKL
jgi:uncharacterized membrane protein